MKTAILLLFLTSCTIQAQEMDTICYTRSEHKRISDSLQLGLRAYHALPSLQSAINKKDSTITAQRSRLVELNYKVNSTPKPKRGFWAMAGLVLGTLTGAILWAR